MSGRAQPAVGTSPSACLLGPSRGLFSKPFVHTGSAGPRAPWAEPGLRDPQAQLPAQLSSAASWLCGPEPLSVPSEPQFLHL